MTIGMIRRAAALVAASVAATGFAAAYTSAAGAVTFTGFQNIDYTTGTNADPAYNAALGLNKGGVIVGFSGSEAADGKRSKGWLATSPYAQVDFHDKNFPKSAQTELVGVNAVQDAVGLAYNSTGPSFGFLKRGNVYTAVAGTSRLLGVNNKGRVVGSVTDSTGTHPVKCSYTATTVSPCARIVLPGNPASATATGINDRGDICGYFTNAQGIRQGFVLSATGQFWQPAGLPYGSAFIGINQADMVVGDYNGSDHRLHGLLASAFTTAKQTVDDPSGVGSTVVRGINDNNQIVGYYTAAGVTHGFLANG